MAKDIKRPCESCGGTTRLEIDHANSEHTGDSAENLMTLCEFCQKTKFHMGNFCFAILLGLSGKDARIKSIIRNSSVSWLARKGRSKSPLDAKSLQSNFFESVTEPQPPHQAPVDRDEVEEIVRKAIPSAHAVDSMENLWVFVKRKGLEG